MTRWNRNLRFSKRTLCPWARLFPD